MCNTRNIHHIYTGLTEARSEHECMAEPQEFSPDLSQFNNLTRNYLVLFYESYKHLGWLIVSNLWTEVNMLGALSMYKLKIK